MTCIELQEGLAEVEHGTNAEQKAHLRNCPACSALVKELSLIISAAGRLQDADEPSPRVWNSIETALRQEGIIRPQRKSPFVPSFFGRWDAARWIVPAATAAIILAAGLFIQQRTKTELTQQASLSVVAPTPAGLNDDDLLQEVAASEPLMKPQYEENLRRVNESIHDAQDQVQATPNDEDARRSLMDAYQQKSMLFEMAMDRTLP